MNLIIVILCLALVGSIYLNVRFGKRLLSIQDNLQDSLDYLNDRYITINKLLKQARHLQNQIARQMEDPEVEPCTDCRIVTVTMNGMKNNLSVKIGKDAIDSGDMTILEDLIMAAAKDPAARIDPELPGTLAGKLLPAFPTR